LGDGRALGVGLVVYAVGQALQPTGNLVLVLAGLSIAGVGVSWAVIAFITSVQLRTPAHLQGRAFAAADTTVTLPQTLSIALGAVLVSVVDYRWLIATMSAVIGLAGAYLLTRRFDWTAPGAGVDAPMARTPFDPAGLTPDVRLDV
jgi:MFS family permease